jgi:hypothetical protein
MHFLRMFNNTSPARGGWAMDEAEWLAERACSQRMMGPLRDTAKVTRTKAGRRKARLFACGCCRLVWGHLLDTRLWGAVDVAEQHADGLVSGEALALAREQMEGLWQGTYSDYPLESPERDAAWMVFCATEKKAFSAAFYMTALPVPLGGYRDGQAQVVGEDALCDLLRCVFGNPFRPLSLTPACSTPTVATLAQAAYEERDSPSGHLSPARLGVLADALEEAGADRALLDHLRSPGPHVRGCFPVDLCLKRG